MINKQNLWFLTLFSLIIVLSIFYLTMPGESLTERLSNPSNQNLIVTNIEESEVLTALRVSSDEEMLEEMSTYQDVLLNESSTMEEKNNAYEALKDLNLIKGKEENLEKIINDKFNLKSFIKIEKNQIKVVISGTNHDTKLANDIIRTINENHDSEVYVTVKFQS